MTSQSAEQIITIHIFFNISRNKEYWTIKFGQLIENDIRNIFIEKSYTKWDGENSPRPFSKKSKIGRISGSIV